MEDFAARLEIGEVLKSERLNATIKGCLLFRELDRIEEEYSYWEEWELSHHSLSDVWVEYDHDDKRVALYEPLTLPEPPTPGRSHRANAFRCVCPMARPEPPT